MQYNAVFKQGLYTGYEDKKIFRQTNTPFDIPRYEQWTIPSLLDQTRSKDTLGNKGLRRNGVFFGYT